MLALYGWQCLHVVPSYAYLVYFVGGAPRVRRGGHLRLSSPWPSDLAVPIGPLPFDVTEDRLYSLALPVRFERELVRGSTPPAVAIAALKEVEALGRTLRINGQSFVRCASHEEAEHIVNVLRAVLPLDEKRRARELRDHYSSSLSLRTLETRLDELRKSTRLLRVCCCALFLLLFVYVPINYWYFYGRHTWTVAAPFLIGTYVLTLAAFYRAHLRLFPTLKWLRWRSVVEIGLFPPALMRSTDLLARQAFCGIHPLAIALRLSARSEFLELMRAELARLAYPSWRGDPQNDNEGRRRSLQIQRDSLLQLLEAAGLSLADLIVTSPTEDAGAGGYCPACLDEFRIGVLLCPNCQVATIQFEQRQRSS